MLKYLVMGIHFRMKTAFSPFWDGLGDRLIKHPNILSHTVLCYVLLNDITNTLKATAHIFSGLSITINVKTNAQHNIYERSLVIMSIIIIMTVCFSKYIYRYTDTFAKIDGKEMKIILNKDMNSETGCLDCIRESVLIVSALHFLHISRCFICIASFQKLNEK